MPQRLNLRTHKQLRPREIRWSPAEERYIVTVRRNLFERTVRCRTMLEALDVLRALKRKR